VSQPDEMTSGQMATLLIEVAIHAAGLFLLFWLLLSRRGRAMPKSQLPEWRATPAEFVLFLCFGLMGATVISGIAGSVLHHLHLSSDSSVVVASAAMEGGFLCGLLCFFAVYGGSPLSQVPGSGAVAGLVSGTFLFLVAMPFVTLVNVGWSYFLTLTGLPHEQQELVSIFENTQSVVFEGAFVVIASLIVPAAEEILFRGGLFRYLRTRMPRWAAITSTSVVFGALHVQWSDHMSGLPSFLPLFVLAAIFCIAYERTGSIATPIVAHALFNLNTIVLAIMKVGS
jgi:membrane protease YdiL (CAAX protease family)